MTLGSGRRAVNAGKCLTQQEVLGIFADSFAWAEGYAFTGMVFLGANSLELVKCMQS